MERVSEALIPLLSPRQNALLRVPLLSGGGGAFSYASTENSGDYSGDGVVDEGGSINANAPYFQGPAPRGAVASDGKTEAHEPLITRSLDDLELLDVENSFDLSKQRVEKWRSKRWKSRRKGKKKEAKTYTQKEQKKLSGIVYTKTKYITLNALIGIVCMVLSLELSWHFDTSHAWGENSLNLNVLRAFISLSSFTLILQIINRSSFHIRVSHGHVYQLLQSPASRKQLGCARVIQEYAFDTHPHYWLALLFVAISPIPFLSHLLAATGDEGTKNLQARLGIAMLFLRIPLFLRFFRDRSAFYRVGTGRESGKGCNVMLGTFAM